MDKEEPATTLTLKGFSAPSNTARFTWKCLKTGFRCKGAVRDLLTFATSKESTPNWAIIRQQSGIWQLKKGN